MLPFTYSQLSTAGTPLAASPGKGVWYTRSVGAPSVPFQMLMVVSVAYWFTPR